MGQSWWFNEPSATPTNYQSTNYTGDLTGTPDGFWATAFAVFHSTVTGTEVPCSGSLNYNLDVGPIAYYFRTRFVAPSNTPSSGLLYLTNYFNDGAIFYLNGTEILRTNMPAGPVGFQTKSSISNAVACRYALLSITNLLMPPPATNVLAAELHVFGNSADNYAYFGASLDFSTNPPPYFPLTTNASPVPPALTVVGSTGTVAGVFGIYTNVYTWATNVGGSNWGLQFTTNLGPSAVWISTNASSPFTNPVSGPRKSFRLKVK
jgi:hypothetical protein